MKATAKVETKAFLADLRKMRKAAQGKVLQEAAMEAGLFMEGRIKSNVQRMEAVDTGEYLNGWRTEQGESRQNYAEAHNANNVNHGPYVEFGTAKMPARPAARKAYTENERQVVDIATKAVASRVKRSV